MVKNIRSIVGACALGLVTLPGAAWSQGFYFNGGVGAAIAEDVDLKSFIGLSPAERKLEFDPGPRFSVAGGYNFNPYIGLEVETGFLWNNIKNVTGVGDIDASLAHVPILGNLVLRCDRPDSKWVPFIGGGAGGDTSILTLDHVLGVDGTSSDFTFAWQAFGGFRYKLADNMSIGASYRYYAVDDASWDVDFGSSTASDSIRIGKANTHNILIDFNLKF